MIIALCWMAGALSNEVKSPSKLYDFNVPSLIVHEALYRVAKKSGHQLLVSSELAETLSSSPVNGRYTVESALMILLEGTNLIGSLTEHGVILVRYPKAQKKTINEEAVMGYRRSRKSLISTFFAIFAAGAVANGAIAQDTNQSTTNKTRANENTISLEEVLVTSRKMQENLQQTGVAVSALTANDIESLGIDQATDLQNYVPNLVFKKRGGSGAFGSVIKIRGIGVSDVDYPTADPSVGVYIDGVFQARAFGSQFELFDLENIEVLRGPQGTLYGKNTLGGAINFVTKKPDGEEGVSFSTTVGNYGRLDLGGTASFALQEGKLFARISGVSKTRNGFTKNIAATNTDLGEEGIIAGRLALRFIPSDDLTIDFASDYSKQRQTTSPIFLTGTNEAGSLYGLAASISNTNPNDFLIPVSPDESDIRHIALDFGAGYTDVLPQGRGANGTPVDNANFYGGSLTMTWDRGPDVTYKSLTSYREYSRFLAHDIDGTPIAMADQVYDDTGWQFTQEFQLNASLLDGKMDFVGGLFFSHEENSLEQTNPLYLQLLREIALDITLLRVTNLESESVAAYFHTVYHLTDSLKLSAGLRYNDENKFNRTQAGKLTTLVQDLPFDASDDKSWDSVQPKIGLDYIINDDLFFYALISKGFASGGFNPRVTIGTNFIDSFDEETLWNYEVGLKTSWMDDRIRFNVAAFFLDYKNVVVQSFSAGTSPDDPIGYFQENAGSAEVNGAEFEFAFQVTENLQVKSSFGVIDQEFTEFGIDDNGDPIDPSNSKFFDSPSRNASAIVQYLLPLGNEGSELSFTADWSYRSKAYFDNTSDRESEQPGYALVNARAIYLFPGEKYSLSLWGDNLTNKLPMTRSFNLLATPLGFSGGQFGPPRTVGITFKYMM